MRLPRPSSTLALSLIFLLVVVSASQCGRGQDLSGATVPQVSDSGEVDGIAAEQESPHRRRGHTDGDGGGTPARRAQVPKHLGRQGCEIFPIALAQ
ncbi:MAG: hypothetical protein IH849_00225 [Acidobacteria bacterium]|nr:hypothetical protein [Acidobacteriota bacterium]